MRNIYERLPRPKSLAVPMQLTLFGPAVPLYEVLAAYETLNKKKRLKENRS